MAEFAVVKQSDAPKRLTKPGRLRARMAQYEDYVMGVRKGQVGKLVPSADESARAVAVRVSRAGKRVNRLLDVWVVDGVVYFRATAS